MTVSGSGCGHRAAASSVCASRQPIGGLFRYFQTRSAVTPISAPVVPATAPGQFLEMNPSTIANKTPPGITIARSRGRFIPSYCHGDGLALSAETLDRVGKFDCLTAVLCDRAMAASAVRGEIGKSAYALGLFRA